MFTQHVYAKLLARLGEPEHAIKGDHIGEDPSALIEVRHLEELEGHLVSWSIGQSTELCHLVKVVQPLMLMM